jgi:hypothetical protein
VATDDTPLDRRTLLASIGSLAGAGSLAGCALLERGEDVDTTELADDRALELAERFAPTLYFDEHERWFPTDPRPYTTDEDGETVGDGFAALDGYTDRFDEDEPPAPTMFYHGVEYDDSPLAAVQFWYYSAFDQFTTNFHWHDWEVLHVFVDTETDEPQLYVASSHSGRVPNNEFLDPDPEQIPRILSELGSHSSALSLNDAAERFQRFPFDGSFADITNSAFEGIERFAEIPVAYGLPRDEGSRLPYLVPELDGAPLHEHDRLPSVEGEDLIPDSLAVGSFADIRSPPVDLPGRSTGRVFGYAGREADADIGYEPAPSSELADITNFSGPQLNFEFAVPAFAEDVIAKYISTSGVPWQQPRYDEPAADVSDPSHRASLSDRYDAIGDPTPINAVIAGVTEAIVSDDAPENEGLTTDNLSTEVVALLESEPEAVPTFAGVAAVLDIPAGDHRLTVNGAGVEPQRETVAVSDDSDGPAVAGVSGEIPLVARENATKLEVDADGTDADLTDLAIEDDFAGRLYDAPLLGPDAVYVHRGGAYTTEVRDADDEVGAFRVNPADEARVRIDDPRTGKGSLAEYIANVVDETLAAVEALDESSNGDGGSDDDDVSDGSGDDGGNGQGGDGGQETAIQGLTQALEAVGEAAKRSADRAAAGERGAADQSLEADQNRLGRIADRLDDAGADLPDDLERAIDHRLDQLDRRSKQARNAEKL